MGNITSISKCDKAPLLIYKNGRFKLNQRPPQKLRKSASNYVDAVQKLKSDPNCKKITIEFSDVFYMHNASVVMETVLNELLLKYPRIAEKCEIEKRDETKRTRDVNYNIDNIFVHPVLYVLLICRDLVFNDRIAQLISISIKHSIGAMSTTNVLYNLDCSKGITMQTFAEIMGFPLYLIDILISNNWVDSTKPVILRTLDFQKSFDERDIKTLKRIYFGSTSLYNFSINELQEWIQTRNLETSKYNGLLQAMEGWSKYNTPRCRHLMSILPNIKLNRSEITMEDFDVLRCLVCYDGEVINDENMLVDDSELLTRQFYISSNCGHVLCKGCYDLYPNNFQQCPMCKQPFVIKNSTSITSNKDKIKEIIEKHQAEKESETESETDKANNFDDSQRRELDGINYSITDCDIHLPTKETELLMYQWINQEDKLSNMHIGNKVIILC